MRNIINYSKEKRKMCLPMTSVSLEMFSCLSKCMFYVSMDIGVLL